MLYWIQRIKETRYISGFHLLIPFYFTALYLILTMALISASDKAIHPDELNHVPVAGFYINNWLPPAISDSRILNTFSSYGMTYHTEWDVVYFFAGKFAWVISPLVTNEVYAVRLFNVFLLFLLSGFALIRRDTLLMFSALLMSPQVWYVFSYFNGDAFPMFVSLLIVYEINSPRSRLNLNAGNLIARLLPMGILLGLLLLSKKTFWMFGVFAAGCLCAKFVHEAGKVQLRSCFKPLGLLAAIIGIVALPRIGLDLYVNGTPSHKAAMILETRQALAVPALKPSAEKSGNNHLNLRSKGVGIVDLFRPPLVWGRVAFYSSFGVYQYMSDFADPDYYIIIGLVYVVFIVYLLAIPMKTGKKADLLYLAWALAASVMVIALSVYHSWVNDFQAQGRYLFAIFCIMSAILSGYQKLVNPIYINLFFITVFALSAYSFVFVALNHIPKAL